MIRIDVLQVGDIILYKRRKKIKEWEVISVAPSGDYIEIENDTWSERWVYRGDILEIVESTEPEIEITVSIVEEVPSPRDRPSKFK